MIKRWKNETRITPPSPLGPGCDFRTRSAATALHCETRGGTACPWGLHGSPPPHLLTAVDSLDLQNPFTVLVWGRWVLEHARCEQHPGQNNTRRWFRNLWHRRIWRLPFLVLCEDFL